MATKPTTVKAPAAHTTPAVVQKKEDKSNEVRQVVKVELDLNNKWHAEKHAETVAELKGAISKIEQALLDMTAQFIEYRTAVDAKIAEIDAARAQPKKTINRKKPATAVAAPKRRGNSRTWFISRFREEPEYRERYMTADQYNRLSSDKVIAAKATEAQKYTAIAGKVYDELKVNQLLLFNTIKQEFDAEAAADAPADPVELKKEENTPDA